MLLANITKLNGSTSSGTNGYTNTQVGCHCGWLSDTRTIVLGGEGLSIGMNADGEGIICITLHTGRN